MTIYFNHSKRLAILKEVIRQIDNCFVLPDNTIESILEYRPSIISELLDNSDPSYLLVRYEKELYESLKEDSIKVGQVYKCRYSGECLIVDKVHQTIVEAYSISGNALEYTSPKVTSKDWLPGHIWNLLSKEEAIEMIDKFRTDVLTDRHQKYLEASAFCKEMKALIGDGQ